MDKTSQKENVRVHTGFVLLELQQISVGYLWEGTVLFSAAFEKLSSIFVRANSEPCRWLLDSLVHCGRGGELSILLHPEEDEHGRWFFKQVLDLLVSELAQLGTHL